MVNTVFFFGNTDFRAFRHNRFRLVTGFFNRGNTLFDNFPVGVNGQRPRSQLEIQATDAVHPSQGFAGVSFPRRNNPCCRYKKQRVLSGVATPKEVLQPGHVPNRRNCHRKNRANAHAPQCGHVHARADGYAPLHERDGHAHGQVRFRACVHAGSNRVHSRADDLSNVHVPWYFSSLTHIKNPVVTSESRGNNPVFAI